MAQIGVQVLTQELPPAVVNQNSTATAFMVGVADWGSSTTPVQVQSLAAAAAAIGTPSGTGNPYSGRSSTNATLFDSLDVFFREGGATAYISRALGTGSASASIALAPSAALTFTAQYAGVGGNGIFVAATNNSTTYTITLSDSAGNVLATSPALSTLAAGVAWAATTGLVTAASSGSTLPSTAAATAMSGGLNGSTVTVNQLTTALTNLGPSLGPGQVLAPGFTNTSFSGIWSALASHAVNNNRVALCDMDDNTTAAAAVTAIGTFGTGANAGYTGFWSGNLNIPGSTLAPGTTRSVPPSPVVAALCARVDNTGNPNQAAAGQNYSLSYVLGSTSLVSSPLSTYSLTDLATLNGAGINGFQNRNGLFENYGFVAAVPQTTDAIYFQLSHARLRMALVYQAQFVGEPYVFAQIDGQGSTISAFNGAISQMLLTFYNVGALYGVTAADAFTVNTGPAINTPSSLAAGNLLAQVAFRPSPFAQFVQLTLNAVPITQALQQPANPAQGQ